MNKKYFFWIVLIIVLAIIIGIFIYNNSNKDAGNSNEFSNNTARLSTQTSTENTIEEAPPKEEEISSYSTELKSKASGRLNNIRITCDTLNGTTVSVGETFSFCDTLRTINC